MKKTRKAMFETNSSSCHSIIIDLGDYKRHKLSRNGRLIVTMGYYDEGLLVTPRDKINWLFSMLFTICEGNCYEDEDFQYDLENFLESRKYEIQKIQACIEEVEGPIYIEYRKAPGENGVGMNHELHDEWYDLDDYLKEVGVSLKDFIYSGRVKVNIYHD